MSLRTAFSRFFHQGKWVLQKFITKPRYAKPVRGDQRFNDATKPPQLLRVQPKQQGTSLFSTILTRNATNTLVSELRRRSAWPFRNGSLPTFAFGLVGLALASKSEEDDAISESVRDIFRDYTYKPISPVKNEGSLTLDMFDIGRPIGKGCNAAVYEVRMKGKEPSVQEISGTTLDLSDSDSDLQILDEDSTISSQDSIDLFAVTYERETTTDSSVEQIVFCDDEYTDETPKFVADDDIIIIHVDDINMDTDDSFEMVPPSAESLPVQNVTEVTTHVLLQHKEPSSIPECEEESRNTGRGDFDQAMKMMFNYDTASNTDAIMKAWRKEIVPVTSVQTDVRSWKDDYHMKNKELPPHPNIVDIHGVFVDMVPQLPDGIQNYPMALPQHINPDGHGRNKTMFILMKKYTMTLRDYLNMEDKPSIYTRCVLLTQLLEGIVHLRSHGIAHRDLKSDNILLDISEGNIPQLVISDFGCCLADSNFGLKIPYQTDETDRGGIPTLMAPEIASAIPGKKSWLDYNKADLWTVGTLVYELFGMENPFLNGNDKLDCRNYTDAELPRLPDEVPDLVRILTRNMLRNDPKQRPSPEDAANLMQIYLWFPEWLTFGLRPTQSVIINNLLILAAKLLIGCCGNTLNTMDQLQLSFLKRFRFSDIRYLLNM